MARRDFDEALAQAKESEEIGRRLYDLDPQNFLWRRDYGGRLRNLGLALRARKDTPAARENFDSALSRQPGNRVAPSERSRGRISNWRFRFISPAGNGRRTKPRHCFARRSPSWRGSSARGEMPKANANWADFIRKKLARLNRGRALDRRRVVLSSLYINLFPKRTHDAGQHARSDNVLTDRVRVAAGLRDVDMFRRHALKHPTAPGCAGPAWRSLPPRRRASRSGRRSPR